MIDLVVNILLYVASVFMLIGAIGMLRFPDFYTRVHAANLVTVGGVCFFLLTLAAYSFWTVYTIKIIVIVIFTFMTSPLISHALANTAYELNVRPKGLVKNEMKKSIKKVMVEEHDI